MEIAAIALMVLGGAAVPMVPAEWKAWKERCRCQAIRDAHLAACECWTAAQKEMGQC